MSKMWGSVWKNPWSVGCKIYLALNLYKSTAAIGALRPVLTYAQVKIIVQCYTVYHGHFGGRSF